MTELSLFRTYSPHELGKDGYPHIWHTGLDLEEVQIYGSEEPYEIVVTAVDLDSPGGDGVKDLVRARAGNRCVRCGHPFKVGESGQMEGDRQHDAKAFAADLGMNVEAVQHALFDYADVMTEDDIAKAKLTNWSPCDEKCTHGGPIRVREEPGHPWIEIEHTNAADELAADCDAVEAAWRILTVHHLNGRKHDLRWWNLIPCCQRCHLWLQRRVIMERVYPFEHDDYFKPYAAGWYAYAYHGENLTREETEDRMDELLALERMA